MAYRLPAEEVLRRQRTQSGRLKEEEVGRIKWLLRNGHTARSLAQVYGMSLWTIRAIRRGDTWAWVKPLAPDQVLEIEDNEWKPSQEELDKSLEILQEKLKEPVSLSQYMEREKAEKVRPPAYPDESPVPPISEEPSVGLERLMSETDKLVPQVNEELEDFLK